MTPSSKRARSTNGEAGGPGASQATGLTTNRTASSLSVGARVGRGRVRERIGQRVKKAGRWPL